MKKKTISSKLNLAKTTVSNLNNLNLENLKGGNTSQCGTNEPPCNSVSICPVTCLTTLCQTMFGPSCIGGTC